MDFVMMARKLRVLYREADIQKHYQPKPIQRVKALTRGAKAAVGTIRAKSFLAKLEKGAI